MRFSVLGPVRAWRGEAEVDLGPPQQRAVLVALLLAEGSQVSAGGLVDAVWGTGAPASALGILRGYVHRLRKSLEPDADAASSVISSTGDGYQLRTASIESDLSIFRDLLVQAERARGAADARSTVAYLRDALRLWQGTALAGMRGEYAQSRRQRLDELRLSAQAARITAELDLGAHAQITTELAALVTEHPLDERFRELLMLALYRSGQQAAALATYREAQTLLVSELGIDPGPALQAMYRSVLRADSGLLTPPAPVEPAPSQVPAVPPGQASTIPAQLPADPPVFVGRAAELAEVTRLPSAGTVVVSAIAGMAGVGKTAFAVHWARQVSDRFTDGQLYLNLRGFDPVAPPVTPEHAVRTLLESLGADRHSLPHDLDALVGLYRTMLTGRRVLILLDNARDAAQVRPLLPGAPGCLVIVTSRNRLTGLVATDGAHPLNLDVLSVREARELLTRRIGPRRTAAEPGAVEEIITRCARLPLALAVTAAHAATRPTVPLAAIAAELRESAGGLDAFHDGDAMADVRAVFSWSYHALTPEAARLFRLLALHPGPDITLPAAASLAARSLPHSRRLLGELMQTHLVDEAVAGRYASHDLLRAYATEMAQAVDPPQQVRAARSRMFDHYLHTAHAAAALTNRARAQIALPSAAEGVRAEAFHEDQERAEAWFNDEQAVLLAVVEQADAHRYDVHLWQFAWALSNHLHLRGLWREEEAVHRAALDAAHRLGDRTAQAYVHRGLGTATAALGRFDEAGMHAERAIELFAETGDTRACAESYRTLAWAAEQQGNLEAALRAAQRSLALFRTSESPAGDDGRGRRAVASALNAVGWNHVLLGQHQQALEHCRQALALCQELGDNTNAAHTWDSIGHAHHHIGEYEEAVTAFRNALVLYRQLGGAPWFVGGTLMRLGDTWLSAGDPDAARTAWAEALEIMERLGHADAEHLRTRLDRLDEPGGPSEPDTAVSEP
ncbi:AfsR/SARP family transcriptional regulator [Streptomyces tauricus]|uniref:AfsR/SARP family transcriptional regulator n=1 Tax=Streptomyces tauricus TaxID=68274 RepID=UPI0022443A66|nr:BTAD domain-containing putative transcriptional regulator [Streptomyces tauricus]MCW8103382.1 BTAD domain-containing putative transcriptional regulator [Streptomyces tauricus]